MTLNRFRNDITRRAEAGETLTAIAGSYHVTSAGISIALKRWGIKLIPVVKRVGRPVGAVSHMYMTANPIPLADLPILPSGFIRALTKAELMGGKGYGR